LSSNKWQGIMFFLKYLLFVGSIFHCFTKFNKLLCSVGWLQGRVAHFLRCNLVFCRVACIYMLLTWHTNNNFPNLWLDLDCQLEEKDIYIKQLQHIHTKYIVMDFLSWKIWIGLMFVPLYTCIFVYKFYLGYIIRTQYMIC
jgi:hypothetical protein